MALLWRLLLTTVATACVHARQPDPVHHAQAALLFEDSLKVAQLQRTADDDGGVSAAASAAVAVAAIDGLLQSGAVLLQAGDGERALRALDAVLRATPPSPSGAVSQEHLQAMVLKLGAVRRAMTLTAAEAPHPSEDDEFLNGRWAPQNYWLDWVSQWEVGRGPVQRAAGCADPQAGLALDHLQQLTVDLEVRRIPSCLVGGLHGTLLRRGKFNTLSLLQLPSVPDTSAPLLSSWALGLLPSDFQMTEGSNWPFELPLSAEAAPTDFSGRAIVRRAARYLHDLQPETWAGFGAASRGELEAARIWQSADELRHYESQQLRDPSRCEGRPEVVHVNRLVSATAGYSLNYFHWMTEILPGLLRLLPLIRQDSSVRVLTHAGVDWSRSVLVDILGIQEGQLIEDDGCAVYEADTLYTWSSDNPLSPQLLEHSRRLLRAAAAAEERNELTPCECCTSVLRRSEDAGSAEPSRRAVLLDRRGAIRGRSIANHEDVAAALADELPTAFEVCSLAAEKCSVAEQMSCFATADLAVGVEGAGLTNALVMPRGATVVNLHPAHPSSSFSTLVSECGQSYFWQLASASALRYFAFVMPSFTFSDPEGHSLDIAELRRFLGSEGFAAGLAERRTAE